MRYWSLFIPFLLFSQDLEKVSLQLNWKYQFEFAGFIMAKEMGYYKEANLDVEIKEYQNGVNITKDVLDNKVNFGLKNNALTIENKKIIPNILLATYFQTSPFIIVAQKEIKNPAQLRGKKVMIEQEEIVSGPIDLLLENYNINTNNTIFLPHSFDVEAFINKDIDAMSAFTSNELYFLDKLGITYTVLNPANYGFYTNAVNLFTSPKEYNNHKVRCDNFVKATNRGWEYALSHTKETIQILQTKYSVSKSKEALFYEANVTKKLMMTNIYKIGELTPELTIRLYKQLKASNSIQTDENMEDMTKKIYAMFTKSEKVIDYLFLAQLFIFFTFISLGLFYKQSILKKLNQELTFLKENLQKEVDYKNILLKELHHRVKNNLQIILSILSINSNKEVIKNQINAIKLAHEKLTYNGVDNSVDLPNYLADLGYEVTLALKIEIEILGNAKKVDIDTAINIGIIINELISNSIKYALDHNPTPSITITIETINEKTQIIYCDNGKNYLNKNLKKGLGLNIIESIVKNKLKGNILFKLKNGFYCHIIF
ncbi:MAG: ABC transporter substrate-binding protein [Arcobacteraceae bacterium]|nr:ABC transporter substrate-binding protein [Arcobacteraceae bacterium]